MTRRDAFLQVKKIEQLALIPTLPTHHGEPPVEALTQTESWFAYNHEPFFNTIDPKQKSA
jgi:hypothetical protein